MVRVTNPLLVLLRTFARWIENDLRAYEAEHGRLPSGIRMIYIQGELLSYCLTDNRTRNASAETIVEVWYDIVRRCIADIESKAIDSE